jgi:hypothetical protein
MSNKAKSCTPAKGEVYSFFDLQGFLMIAEKGTYYTVQQIKPEHLATMHVCRNGDFNSDYGRGDGVLFYHDGDICSADNSDEFRLLGIHHALDIYK